MAKRIKKAKFTPKPKKTLVPAPNWEKLEKANTEEKRMAAWTECEQFVHAEVTDKEYLHSMKKWIRSTDWNMVEQSALLPDTFMLPFAKHGWKAIRLGFMPENVERSIKKNLLPLLEKAQKLRDRVTGDPAIHPSVLEKDEDHALYYPTVKEWIAETKAFLKASKNYQESPDPALRNQYRVMETYLYNLNQYVKMGVWLDSHYGEKREYKQVAVCVAPAYHADGTQKRTVGLHYLDVGGVWTKEMEGYHNDET
jgi:hypothetical protein